MSLSLADLTTPVTVEEAETSVYDVLAALGVSTTSWKPGAVVRTMIVAVAIIVAAFSDLTSNVAKGGFLETATGPWLTLTARHVYNVERQVATFGAGTIKLTNSGGGVFSLGANDLVFSNPLTGRTFRNTGAVNIPALSNVTIPIRAVESGALSTSAPNQITVMDTPLTGVTCTNLVALVGLDEESDNSLRARCSEKLGSLSPNGPWDAFAYAARTAKTSTGIPVGVTRVRVTKDGFGRVFTFCATPSGSVTGTMANPATDIGAVHDNILRKAAPLAVTAVTSSAATVTQNIAATIYIYNTVALTNAQIEALVLSKLATYVSTQPIGGHVRNSDPGKIFHDAIRSVIASTRPEIWHVALATPAADVVLADSDVMVLGTVTLTINQVAPPESGF